MAEKVTLMVLEVDLQCPCCYKGVKKLLCKFPQIRDQVYDEKKNTVTITVICCSPEKIRDKLCCKGGKIIKSIKIIPPPKPKPPEKPPAEKPASKPAPVPVPVPLPAPKAPQPAPKAPEPAPKAPEPAPKAPQPAPKAPEPAPKAPEPAPKAPEQAPKAPKPAPKAPEPAPKPAPAPPQPVPTMPIVPGYGCPSIFPYPFEACCGPCSEGQGGGPCYHGYGRPQPCYDNYGYGPYCRGRRPYYVSRCDEFLSDENTSACTIM